MTIPGSMYLVLPVPFRMQDGALYVEGAGRRMGLDRWADNFAEVTVAAPVGSGDILSASLAGVRWLPVSGLEHVARIRFQPLPWAYSPKVYYKVRAATVAAIRLEIERAEHLQYCHWRAGRRLGGECGARSQRDGAEVLRCIRIAFEHEVMRRTLTGAGLVRRLRVAVEAPLMKRLHRKVIEGASLGLWHGDDCFRAYSPWCGENHLIHDVHTKAGDLISDADLAGKLEDVMSAPVLRICYNGRLDPMKAPLEWLGAVAAARSAGAQLEAVWFGEGSLLAEAQTERARLGLEEVVRFGGFVGDRAELLAQVKRAHVLMFTHVTPESPRNLLEALVCGTPILGYANPYAVDLVAGARWRRVGSGA